MKILLVAPSSLPVPATRGGAIENTLEAIADYNEKHAIHDYTIITIFDEEARAISKKYKHSKFIYIRISFFEKAIEKIINIFLKKNQRVDFYGIKAKKVLKGEKFDLGIIHNRPAYFKYFFSLASQLALHLHNDKLNINSYKAQKTVKEYDYFFTVSNYIRDRVVEIDSKAEVFTLYNGVDLELFKGIKGESNGYKLRKELGISEENIVFLYVGRIVPEKGVMELVQAFERACKKCSNISLIIAGGDKNEAGSNENYQKKVKQISGNNVIYTGYLPHSKLPLYESISDVGVVPSMFEEPFGKVVIEHLASNNPVIVSDAGGIPEIVTTELQGVIVPRNADFINNMSEQIIKFSERKYSHNIRGTVSHFNIEIFNKKRLAIIESKKK